MKAEIFSIRVNEEETGALNSHFDDITKVLLANNVEVLYKTEIDNDRNKLEQAMQKSAAEAEALDMVILANFSDSKDETSLLNQFGSYISKVFYDKPNKNEINPPSDVNSPQPAYSLGDMGNGYHGFVFTYHNITVVALPCASLCEKSVSLLIANGTLLSMAAINPERFSIHPTYVVNNEGLLKRKGKRKKVKWYSYLVPVKGDPLSEVLRKTVVIASSIVLFVSVYLILNIMVIQPEQNAQSDNNIQQIANGNSNNNSGNADETLGNSNSSLKGANAELVKDWSALAKINTDIIGWITQPQTVINYPVLASSSDNSSTQFYLYRNYEKADDIFGSIFKDYRSSDGINSRNIVLHGHNMLNGSRFASIVKYGNRYGGSLSYYQAHPIIYFDTPQWNGERSEWKIIAEFKIQVSQKKYFNYMQGHFSSDAEFMNFIYNIRVRSQFNIPIDVNEHDQLLTLSTCSYEFPETRTVVVARRIRAGESSTVDVSKATLNSNPLYPTEKYKEDGGTPPKVTDFQTALAAGQINWYDGGGKVSGSQTLVPNNQPATTPVTKPKVQATNPPIQTPTSAPVIQKATTAPKPAATNPPTKAATTPVQKTTNPPTATKPAG